MVFRYSRKELAEYGRRQSGKRLYHASSFPDFHYAEPKSQDACQSEGYFEPCLCRSKRSVDDVGENFRVSTDDQFAKRHHEGDQKEGDPDII